MIDDITLQPQHTPACGARPPGLENVSGDVALGAHEPAHVLHHPGPGVGDPTFVASENIDCEKTFFDHTATSISGKH